MSLLKMKSFQQGNKISSFHVKLNGEDDGTPKKEPKEPKEQQAQKEPGKKSVSFSFASAKNKKELMAMYSAAVKKDPKNKEKLLDLYLQRLLEINDK